jgi:serine/threonine-protein kinase
LRGLQAAHEHCDETGKRSPVVHRDVSPDNILISYSGIAKLVDFGIARAKRQDRTLGAENRIERNLGYAAPEQVRSEAVDPRTDLFAAGVTLYLLTTGRHPFQGKDSAATLRNILSDEPPTRPSVLKTSYSRTLEAVVMKALEKDPNRRWPSAEEMRLALERGVPQAFELGFEAQLRTFMADTVGDRGQKKREAIRRAEIVVDAGAGEPGGGTSKSSVKSLRAISVNTRAVRSEPEPAPTRRSMMPTLRPLLARSVPPPGMRKPLLIGTVAAVALVLGLVLLRTPSQSHNAASAPTVSMVDLNPPRPMAVPPALVQSAAANPTLPSAAAPPSSAPASRAKPLRKTAK